MIPSLPPFSTRDRVPSSVSVSSCYHERPIVLAPRGASAAFGRHVLQQAEPVEVSLHALQVLRTQLLQP